MSTISASHEKKAVRRLITNGKLIQTDNILEDGYIIIENDKITAIGTDHPSSDDIDEIIDAEQQYISPGFIDLHTHGAGGADFMDGTVDAYLTVANTHARYGTTALLPTTLTCSDEELFHTFEIYRQAKKTKYERCKVSGHPSGRSILRL